MYPHDNPFNVLSQAVGAINPRLVNKLEAVEKVRPTAGTVHELNKRNSYGVFSAVDFRGTVEVSYDRIDLSKLMASTQKQDIRVYSRLKPANSHQALQLVNRKWHLGLQTESIELLPVSYDGEGVGNVTIKAKEGALDVIGEFKFIVYPGADNISELNLNFALGDALYPSGQSAKGQAQLLSYPADTTTHNAYLSSVWAGQPIDAEFIAIINELTGVEWTTAPGAYSLAGAAVTYAGEVRPGWDVPKENHVRIVVIKLSSSCTNFAGELVFYHNPN